MIQRNFVVNKRDFTRKKRLLLKTKIIRTLQAYTLRDFVLDAENNTVQCKMTMVRNGIKRELPKQFTILYKTEDIPGNELEVKLSIYATTE